MKLRWLLLLLSIGMAFAFPASTIWNQNKILTHGSEVKLRLSPIDPYDPFRGRYVWLNFDANAANFTEEPEGKTSLESAYLAYSLDADGFLQPLSLHLDPPSGTPFLRVTKVSTFYDNSWRFRFPFDRFYLNEYDAPRAEKLSRDALRPREGEPLVNEAAANTYLIVRVLNGEAATVDLIIDGKPIDELLAEPVN